MLFSAALKQHELVIAEFKDNHWGAAYILESSSD